MKINFASSLPYFCVSITIGCSVTSSVLVQAPPFSFAACSASFPCAAVISGPFLCSFFFFINDGSFQWADLQCHEFLYSFACCIHRCLLLGFNCVRYCISQLLTWANDVSKSVRLWRTAVNLNCPWHMGMSMRVAFASTMSPTQNLTGEMGLYLSSPSAMFNMS